MIREKKYRNDEDIVRLYLDTQKDLYFSILYKKYSPKVYAKCITMLKSEMEAQDALQDIFLKLLSKLSKFGEKSKFSTWLFAITYNHCIDVVRKKKRLPLTQDDDDYDLPDPTEEVSDAYILEVKLNELKTVLDVLRVEDKSILLMKYQDGMKIEEIAEAMDKSQSAVKMKIKRAKEKFKLKYQELFSDRQE